MSDTNYQIDVLAETPMAENRFDLGKECAYRMDAYYFGFAPTGLDVVDRILCAVACAGKGYHHTEDWNSESSPRKDYQRGTTPVEIIQNAAIDSADLIRNSVSALLAERDALYAVRIAYASEFPPNSDGDPDVGSIHANIRSLKAERDALAAEVKALRDAVNGLKFDIYEIECPEIREQFDGKSTLYVIDVETLRPLKEVMPRQSAPGEQA